MVIDSHEYAETDVIDCDSHDREPFAPSVLTGDVSNSTVFCGVA